MDKRFLYSVWYGNVQECYGVSMCYDRRSVMLNPWLIPPAMAFYFGTDTDVFYLGTDTDVCVCCAYRPQQCTECPEGSTTETDANNMLNKCLCKFPM